MTSQNVVALDFKSRINTLIAGAASISNSHGRLSLVLPKRSGGSKVNTWIDSMGASSPTSVKSTFPASENQEQSSWIIHHPSALTMIGEIMCTLKGRQIVTFLDYDGTLSPIVDDPDRAFMSNHMRATLRNTARHFPTAIVTGRCRDEVYEYVGLRGLYYAGSRGIDIMGPTEGRSPKKGNAVLYLPASEFLPMIDEAYKNLLKNTKFVPGAKVQKKKFCLLVHLDLVDEKNWSSKLDWCSMSTKTSANQMENSARDPSSHQLGQGQGS